MAHYFERLGPRDFRPTRHVAGAWRTDEQHIAPALGLIAHVVEGDRDARRDDRLVIGRLSYDILGVLPLEPFEISTRVLRPGRTIELVEATLTHAGRPAVSARVWLLAPRDTAGVAGGDPVALPGPEALPSWDPTTVWPGDFIGSAEVRRDQDRPGRARYWVRSDVGLIDEPVGSLSHAARLFDIANGMTVREDPRAVAFPNVDLTAHLFREPSEGWLGFDTTVSFGADGLGVTSSVLHDESGPFGTLAQSLTVRPG